MKTPEEISDLRSKMVKHLESALAIDTRWATTNAAEIRRHAAELAALAPDVILVYGASTMGPLLQASCSVA